MSSSTYPALQRAATATALTTFFGLIAGLMLLASNEFFNESVAADDRSFGKQAPLS